MKGHFIGVLASMACGLLALAPRQARSNDTTFGDPNGGIVFTRQDSIQMRKEVLDISETAVRVEYEFLNTSSKDTTVSVTFPMPPRYFGSADHSEITEFKIWADSTPITPEHRVVILWRDSIDITPEVKRRGWTENDIGYLLANEETPPKRKPLPRKWFDSSGQAQVSVVDHYTWRQTFPAGKSVAVRHTYVPSITTGIPNPVKYLVETYRASHCIDSTTRTRMERLETELGVNWAQLQYVLMTANNWQGPIQDFTLRIHKRKPADAVSLCLSLPARKVDGTTFEFHATDFRPQKDLDILFTRKLEL